MEWLFKMSFTLVYPVSSSDFMKEGDCLVLFRSMNLWGLDIETSGEISDLYSLCLAFSGSVTVANSFVWWACLLFFQWCAEKNSGPKILMCYTNDTGAKVQWSWTTSKNYVKKPIHQISTLLRLCRVLYHKLNNFPSPENKKLLTKN